MKNQFSYDEKYFLLKKSIEDFKKDLQNFRKIIADFPQEKLLDLMADIVGVKELISEGLEKDFVNLLESK